MKPILLSLLLAVGGWLSAQTASFDVISRRSLPVLPLIESESSDLKNAMHVSVSVDSVLVNHQTGKAFWKTHSKLVNIQTKEEDGKTVKFTYIMQAEFNGFLHYFWIEKTKYADAWMWDLKFPIVSKTGEVLSYYIYSSDFILE